MTLATDVAYVIWLILAAAAIVLAWVLAVVFVARDARRRGMFWQWWGFAVAFNPVIFGVAYLLVRGGYDPAYNAVPRERDRRWPRSQSTGRLPRPEPLLASRYGYDWWPSMTVLGLVAGVGFSVFLIWSAATGQAVGWYFAVLFPVAVLVSAYISLFRVAYKLELDDRELKWKGVLRSGSMELAAIRRLHPVLTPNFEAITSGDGSIWVPIQKGFGPFVEDIAARVPEVKITFTRWVDWSERVPGASGYSRR